MSDSSTPKIETLKVPVVSGYGSAATIIRPWVVFVDGKQLVDSRGHARRFSNETAVIAAAKRSLP